MVEILLLEPSVTNHAHVAYHITNFADDVFGEMVWIFCLGSKDIVEDGDQGYGIEKFVLCLLAVESDVVKNLQGLAFDLSIRVLDHLEQTGFDLLNCYLFS